MWPVELPSASSLVKPSPGSCVFMYHTVCASECEVWINEVGRCLSIPGVPAVTSVQLVTGVFAVHFLCVYVCGCLPHDVIGASCSCVSCFSYSFRETCLHISPVTHNVQHSSQERRLIIRRSDIDTHVLFLAGIESL